MGEEEIPGLPPQSAHVDSDNKTAIKYYNKRDVKIIAVQAPLEYDSIVPVSRMNSQSSSNHLFRTRVQTTLTWAQSDEKWAKKAQPAILISYHFLRTFYVRILVPPICTQRDTYRKVHTGQVIGGSKLPFTHKRIRGNDLLRNLRWIFGYNCSN